MKFLDNKSTVNIIRSNDENGKYSFAIDNVYSENNKPGSCGENDYIRRSDAVRMIAAMNHKMNTIVREYFETRNMEIPDELKNTDEILSYVLWGLREIDGFDMHNVYSEKYDGNLE